MISRCRTAALAYLIGLQISSPIYRGIVMAAFAFRLRGVPRAFGAEFTAKLFIGPLATTGYWRQ
jgi:hypothetical protein